MDTFPLDPATEALMDNIAVAASAGQVGLMSEAEARASTFWDLIKLDQVVSESGALTVMVHVEPLLFNVAVNAEDRARIIGGNQSVDNVVVDALAQAFGELIAVLRVKTPLSSAKEAQS